MRQDDNYPEDSLCSQLTLNHTRNMLPVGSRGSEIAIARPASPFTVNSFLVKESYGSGKMSLEIHLLTF